MVQRHGKERGGDARVSRLVPWIFRNEADNFEELQKSGQLALLVNVENSEGREIGTAVCNLHKGVNIIARMLSDNVAVPIDQAFFVQRIRRALEHRKQFLQDLVHCRLVNGEGDLLPGVLCDRYNDALCVQFTSAAMECLLEQQVLDALEEVLEPRAIIQRYDLRRDRQLEHAPIRAPAVVRGSYTGPTVVEEGGFAYAADLLAEAWCSGRLFEDRPLRALLGQRLAAAAGDSDAAPAPQDAASMPQVLSLFSENLGVFCAATGARTTCGVASGDAAAGQQAQLEALAARNGCAERVKVLQVDGSGAQGFAHIGPDGFDIVTLEPPPLAPTYGPLEDATRQYTALVAAAAAALKPGGLLLVVCRSRAMSTVRLLRCVNLGVWSCGRRAQVVYRTGAAPGDFPMHMALPNTGQLQAIGLRVF